jgi:L-glutamine-phosphate cytidylyltransferase
MPLTEDTPKCFAEVHGRRLLDWARDAFAGAGISDLVFIGGYQIDRVRDAYPDLTFCHNAGWEHNNILASLFHAEEYMADGFICAYSDILYRPGIVQRLRAHTGDMTLVIDTAWRDRYTHRSQHPEDDAEKVLVADQRISAIGRTIPAAAAHGEYIGVARFSPAGAATLREHYHRVRAQHADSPFQRARSVQTAYLIDLFQELLDRGETLEHLDTHGGYLEIDTTEDYRLACNHWSVGD